MSPASSGTLEVERYIGACLISQNRNQINGGNGALAAVNKSGLTLGSRDQFYGREHHYIADIYQGNYVNLDASGRFRLQRCNSVEGWAGGMPLISFANHQRRVKRMDHDVAPAKNTSSSLKFEDQHSPLARLAVHTQGAPLILTKSYGKKNKVQKNPPSKTSEYQLQNGRNTKDGRNQQQQHQQQQQVNVSVVDAISVASDESSGSANSENCLPRIIKPRKRRKKDRKPLLGRPPSQDGFSTDSASPDIEPASGGVNFRPYLPFNFDIYSYRTVPESLPLKNNAPTLIDHLHIVGDISETPKLLHSFDEVEEWDEGKDVNGNQATTTCQCRYCDPSGLIWDVDRSCYSPYLTPPNTAEFFNYPEVTLDHLLHTSYLSEHIVSSVSSLSLEEEPHQRISGSDATITTTSNSRSCSDLEVSTEIVTSLNGHRDLEIKFFTSSTGDGMMHVPSKLSENCVDIAGT